MLIHAGLSLAWQAGLIGTAAVVTGLSLNEWAVAAAVLFGGAAAVLNSGLLWWRWWLGGKQIHCDPVQHLRSFRRSSLERFFVVSIWLSVGFTILRLQPLPILSGFVVGQVAWVVANLLQRERT